MNRNIDILKYVMSIMIIMIHASVFFNAPLLRIAVPIFFIISSYFFFHKIRFLSDNNAKDVYVKFLKRATKLYLFWFIFLLPYMIVFNLKNGTLISFVTNLPGDIIFRSSFPVSWYISAYIIGISIMYKFRTHNIVLLIISICCYIICCIDTNYAKLFVSFNNFKEVVASDHNILINYFKNFYHSFPAGLIFIWFGKQIADININNLKPCKYAWSGVIGFVLLMIENKIITLYGFRLINDCYISLIVFAPSIFIIVLSIPQFVTFDTSILRKMSTIYYCSHVPIIRILQNITRSYDIPMRVYIIFLMTFIICSFLSILFIKLSSYKKFNILRLSY